MRAASGLRVEISFPSSVQAQPLDGRVFLMVSTDGSQEPRFQISDEPDTQQFFGIDVDGMRPDSPVVIDGSVLGYPLDSIDQLRSGDYFVQALLNVYTTFHRSDGHTVKLPMDQGEGQQWNQKPGNLYSAPQRVHLDPGSGTTLHIRLMQRIPPISPPHDSTYVKHFQIKSRLLSAFWGAPMYLGAIVTLPPGWDTHPNARYPLVIEHGHFTHDVAFQTSAPGPELTGEARTAAQYHYQHYLNWSEGRLPKVLMLRIQHANPYYDDSYAVNSANLGPYGDAVTQELIPEVERRFRGIGQPWARAMFGGSTGGWETLGAQVFYPDYFNGAWCLCPDPVDFRAYQIVDVYHDRNAHWLEGPFSRLPRPNERKPDGTVTQTMDRSVRRELVLGTHGRSGDQFDIWQAVFGPVAADGYPQEIWDQRTGVINHAVANYWREHYDLRYVMARDWTTLGPKLSGKLYFAVGEMDSYYLNNAVHLMQDFMETTQNPHYVPAFDYGPRMPHCWTGGKGMSFLVSELTTTDRLLPQITDHMLQTAPPGADISSWRY
jgi:hypothetical protein